MPGGNSLAEYVIRLGAEMDNQGLNQILSTLDLTKLKAAGLTAALAALTTGVYKFISSLTKQQFEMEALAKQQKKTIQNTVAEQQALKAMGMTLNEIKKDEALKSIYDDLVKFNKEMELPNADRAYEKVRNLQGAFWKLKSAVNYALQAIANQVLTNLEMPMNRIGGKLRNAADWIRDNLTSVATKIGSYITAFAKGVIGITEGVGKIVEWIGKIPASVKGIALAITAVIALLKSGPLGQILAAVGVIGDIIHDYENYQWNKQNKDIFVDAEGKATTDPNKAQKNSAGEPMTYQVDIAFGGIWEILSDDETDTREKSKKIFSRTIDGVIKGLGDAINTLTGSGSIREMVSSLTGPLGEVIGGIIQYLDTPEGFGQVKNLIGKVFTTMASGLSWAGDTGVDLSASMITLFEGIFKDTPWEKVWGDEKLKGFLSGNNSFATGLSDFLIGTIAGVNPVVSIISGAIGGFQKSKTDALYQLYEYAQKNDKNFYQKFMKDKANWTQSEIDAWDKEGKPAYTVLERLFTAEQINEATLGDLQNDFNDTVSMVFEMLVQGINLVGNISQDFIKKIIPMLFSGASKDVQETVNAAFSEIGHDNPVWNAIVSGFGLWIGTGDFWTGLIGGMVAGLASAKDEESLKAAADELTAAFEDIWYGALVDDGKGGKKRNGVGLKTFFDRIWEGDGSETGGIKGFISQISGEITVLLEPLTNAIIAWSDTLWGRLYDASPDWVKVMMGKLGYGNPNKSTITKNENGTYTLTSTNGKSKNISAVEAYVLSQYSGDTYTIDEKGNIVGSGSATGDTNALWNMYRGLLEGYAYSMRGNKQYQEWLKTDWSGWGEETITFEEYLLDRYGPQIGYKHGDSFDTRMIDLMNAFLSNRAGYHAFLGESSEEFANDVLATGKKVFKILPKVDTSTIDTQLNAEEHIVNVTPRMTGPQEAWGGRIGHEMRGVTVGEDGTEYIIPITKPDRAMALINQMLNEMGSSAINRVMQGLGIGQPGTYGASVDSMSAALSGAVMNNTYNISAPVNINVQSDNASAQEIGTSVYDMAERHLIRNVMGVYA